MKLIDKDALVAEIERKRSDYINSLMTEQVHVLNDVLDFINTLEVKEVDLESEIKKIQKEYKTIDEYDGYPATIYASSIERIAKHFFKLGLKAQKGKEV